MHIISKSAIVPYSSKQMFDLVNNIKDYPIFLNWCADSYILEQNSKQIIASLKINKGIFKQKFTTINTLVTNKKINIQLKEGPFKELSGSWIFQLLNENACKVKLNLNFEFSVKIMDISLAPIFSLIANSQLESFIKRAQQIYG